MKIDDRKPFTYLIGWSALNKWYYGVRYGKRCHPDQLWTSYYTSSKYVHELRNDVGEPDVVQIRKIFTSVQEAVNWETKVLRRMKVIARSDFLNRAYCTASGAVRAVLSEETKAKIGAKSKGRKTFLGRKHTEETKMKLRNKIVSDETKMKMSMSAQERPKMSDETRLKHAVARTGTRHSEETRIKMKDTWARKKAEGYKPPLVSEETRAKHRAREARLRDELI